MITRTFKQLGNSFILSLFLLMASSTFIKAQSITYGCNCVEGNPPGLISFTISTWGCDPGDVISVFNPINLLDENGDPLQTGDTFFFNPIGTPGNTFTLNGLSDPSGPLPSLSILKNGGMHFPDYEMFSCRSPQFPIMPANPTICTGGIVKLTVVDENGDAPTSQVTWEAVGSDTIMGVVPTFSGTNDNMVELSYSTPGTYTVNVSGTSQSSSCDYEFSTTVTVFDAADDAALVGPMELFVCADDMEKAYDVTGIGPGYEVTFKLTNTDDDTSYGPFGPFTTGGTGSGTGSGTMGGSLPGIVEFPEIAGNYEITLCNADTGPGACSLDDVTKSVLILEGPPTLGLPADLTLDHLCVGEEYTIEAVVPNGTTTLAWFEFDCSDASVDPVLLSETGTSLTVTSSGCYRAVIAECQTSCSVVVDVMVTYGNGVDLELEDMKLCRGQALPAVTSGPWSIPINWYASGGSTLITQPQVSGFYRGITAQGSTCEQSMTVFVEVVEPPVVNLGEHDIIACDGSTVILTAGSAGAYTYMWSHDQTEASESITVMSSGTYCVTVTTLDGCCSATDCIEVTFVAEPTVEIDGDEECTFCGSGTLTATITGTTEIIWQKDGVTIAGETTTTLNVTESGIYTAIVAEGLTCEETDSKEVTIINTSPAIVGLSCVCLGSANSYRLENFSNVNETFTVCAANGAAVNPAFYDIEPASGASDIVDITFLVAGNYLIKAQGTTTGTTQCPVTASLAVVALEENFGSIACNNQVNVSLNNNCELELLPEMVLEGEVENNDAYNITITDADGNIVEGMLTQDLIGMTLTVTVSQKCGDNSCWGLVLVEDKSIEPLGPYCTGGPFATTCFEADVPGAQIGFPDFPDDVTVTYRPMTNDWFLEGYDNCSDVVLSFSDLNGSDDCEPTQMVSRTYTVTDATNGAQSSCMVSLRVDLVDLDNIQWPKNFDSALDNDPVGSTTDTDGICPSIELCSGFPVDQFGNPDPSFTGFPSGLVCTNLQVIGYSDRNIPGCGGTKKIVRTWTVWDSCAEESAEHNQTITIMDTVRPICTAPSNGTISNSTHDCGATLEVGPPSVEECSTWTYTIQYQVPGGNFTTAGVQFDATTGNYTIEGLNFDAQSISIKYTVTDDCGNQSSEDCVTEVSLLDTEQPIPACDLFNTITLNQFGLAYAGPSTFDDHSWDNCGIYQLVIQRMDTETSECDCEERTFDFLDFLGSYTNGHYYYISEVPADGTNAIAYAAALGGALAEGESSAEADWIAAQVAMVTNDPVHMSGTSISGPARYVVEFSEKCGFTQTEKFCCEDVGMDVMMMMRVIDNAGNHNFCMTQVKVVDFIKPVITNCPENIVLDCGSNVDLDDLDGAFGELTATDECTVTVTETTDISTFNLDECSQGALRRTWMVTDNSGNSPATTCIQTISVRDTDPFDASDITWPDNVDIDAGVCTLEGIDPDVLPAGSQRPVFNTSACSNVVSNFSDLVFSIVDGACQKMVRTWTVVDWCNPDNIFTYDQIFKLTNTVAPTIDCTSSQLVVTAAGTCSSRVENLTAAIVDNASCTDNVEFTWFLDLEGNLQDISGTGNDASGVYPIGNHTVTFTVTDACGNTSECSRNVRITDDVAPTPYCHSELVLPIGTTDGAEIWASDLDLGSSDSCSPVVTLSFSDVAVITNMTLDCDNIGDNQIELWVWDGPTTSANKSFCVVNIIVQDNLMICLDGNITVAGISGAIMTEQSHMIENVGVSLVSPQMANNQTDMFLDGQFAFNNLPMHNDYQLNPEKDDYYLNGVSTLDLVMMQRHILGIQNLDSPYKVIAADINASASVDGIDLVELRKLILGIYETLPQNYSWRFVDSDQVFNDDMNPFPYNEFREIYSISSDVNNANFIGVKIGDVNNDALPDYQLASGNTENRNRETTVIRLEQDVTESGNIRVQLVAEEDMMLAGAQFSLAFDSESLLAVVPMKISLEDSNIAWNKAEDQVIRFSWNDAEQLEVHKGDVLMEFLFKGDGAVSFVEDLPGFSEVYTSSGSEIIVKSIDFQDDRSADAPGFYVEQNKPNPFKDETLIGFHLPEAGLVSLSITNVDGKLIYNSEANYESGYNEITIAADLLESSGVMYYQIKSGNMAASRKMIILK